MGVIPGSETAFLALKTAVLKALSEGEKSGSQLLQILRQKGHGSLLSKRDVDVVLSNLVTTEAVRNVGEPIWELTPKGERLVRRLFGRGS